MSAIEIRDVIESDLTAIHALANNMTFDARENKEDAAQSGFLVSHFTIDDYKSFYVDCYLCSLIKKK